MSEKNKIFVYIGTWAKKPIGTGIGICSYDPETGTLEPIKFVCDGIIAGSICLEPRRRILYCGNELETHPGYAAGGGGEVYAFAIDPETGDLSEINHQPSYGVFPCYVAVDKTGKYLLAANHSGHTPITKTVKDTSGRYRIALEYDEAATVLFPLNEDGAIGDPCDIYKHSGDGPIIPQQTHPHPHQVVMSPSGHLFAVCDKGADMVHLFRINRQTRKLEVCGGRGYQSVPGSAPRYSVFHPTRPYFFMNHEFKAIVRSYRYDEGGSLDAISTVNALPDGCQDHLGIMQSDLVIHPSGKYLYDLIRGIHAVSVFAINEETGELIKIQTVTLDGAGPRGCAVSPDGRFILIAALTSQKVLSWAIAEDGTISPTGKSVSQPNPAVVAFFLP